MRLLTIIAATILLVACSHNEKSLPDDRPGDPVPADNPELADNSMRITGPLLTLRYDDGGILFSRDNNGMVSAVRLSDEARFEFDPAKPSLHVNGAEIILSAAETLKEKDGCRWYRLTTSDTSQPTYLVISGL